MSKILKAREILEAINLLEQDIDCADQYEHFVEDLAKLLCDHAGGEFVMMSDGDEPGGDGEPLGLCAHFHANECLPADGGVFKHFDTDVVWEDGKETG